MKYWAITDKGLMRSKNEDCYFACCNEADDFALFVVCDGMGGALAGNIASRMACDVFVNEINSFDLRDKTFEEFSPLLYSAALKANKLVYEKSETDLECSGMGTTLVAVLVHEDRALVINIGDSRAYIVSNGAITQITKDHSVVEDMVRRGEITKEEARTHPKKNLITKAIGTAPEVEPDIFSVELKKDDYLLLCSDGLSNIVTEDEIKNTIIKLERPDKVCDILLQATYSRGAPDNVTIVFYKH